MKVSSGAILVLDLGECVGLLRMSVVFLFATRREVTPFADALVPAIEIGVGKSAAAARVARALVERPTTTAILCGIAGAYRSSGLSIGDVCVVDSSLLADEGVAVSPDEFLPIDAMGLGVTEFVRPPYDGLELARELGLPMARAATVSACSGSDHGALSTAMRSGAAIETMESAAVALACVDAGVRLVEIRAISNYCGARARGEWDIDRAVAALGNVMRAVAAMEW